jgi:hypothetical protein
MEKSMGPVPNRSEVVDVRIDRSLQVLAMVEERRGRVEKGIERVEEWVHWVEKPTCRAGKVPTN